MIVSYATCIGDDGRPPLTRGSRTEDVEVLSSSWWAVTILLLTCCSDARGGWIDWETKRSAVLSAVCGRYGIEVRKEGVPKVLCKYLKDEQHSQYPLPVPGVILRSLIGVGSVSSSSYVCVLTSGRGSL